MRECQKEKRDQAKEGEQKTWIQNIADLAQRR